MKRQRSEPHLVFLRRLPCVACTKTPAREAAHIRMARPGLGKRETGKAEKPDDRWALPLCHKCHLSGPDAQHDMSEARFWEMQGIDPCALAMQLWALSGDEEASRALIFRAAMTHSQSLGKFQEC